MNLKTTYDKVRQIIEAVDFSQLWRNFKPLKFALYNDTECFFDGGYIPKTEDFLANTAILYQGEYIAIWYLSGNEDPEILAFKIIHEMFHAFQNQNHESRFPNEMDALTHYVYSVQNLSIKAEENILLASLVKNFDAAKYQKLLRLRKYRCLHYNYEYHYEAAVEQIEGAACFVELNALRQISEEKYCKSLNALLHNICNPEKLFPIRILSYSIGAMLFQVLKDNRLYDFEHFSEITTSTSLLDCVKEGEAVPPAQQIRMLIENYVQKTRGIINKALSEGQCIAEGEFDLLCVNIYNARFYKPFIVSQNFVMYAQDSAEVVKYGDFVIELNDAGRVVTIFSA